VIASDSDQLLHA